MAITKEKKVEIMSDLVSKFKEAKSIGFATTNTITVEEFFKLRKNLREVNASYTLAKKTIIKKAVKEALNIDIEIADLDGQIGVICSNDDAIAGLGKLNAFIKEVNGPKGDLGKMAWSISIFEGELKTKDETKILASLPSKETLLSRLVGSMKSPISALARFFDAAKKDLEAKGVASVGDLKNATPKKEKPKAEKPVEKVENKIDDSVSSTEGQGTEEKKEEIKEEVKTEKNVEIPAVEEVKAETSAEEPKVEEPATEEKVEENSNDSEPSSEGQAEVALETEEKPAE